MKFVCVLLGSLALAACGQQEAAANSVGQEQKVSTSNDTADTVQTTLEQLSVVENHLGEFPFLSAPENFTAKDPQTRSFEQKYVYPFGTTRSVEGRYHHARLFAADGQEWSETLLLRRLDARVRELGGVQVFDGSIPGPAGDLIRENSPKSVADLYDPWPYRFRQYVIRTVDGFVWIEIGYGYNAQMADLTVLLETT